MGCLILVGMVALLAWGVWAGISSIAGHNPDSQPSPASSSSYFRTSELVNAAAALSTWNSRSAGEQAQLCAGYNADRETALLLISRGFDHDRPGLLRAFDELFNREC